MLKCIRAVRRRMRRSQRPSRSGKKGRGGHGLRGECGEESVITHGVALSPSARRGKRYSLITDDKWFVSAVMRPGGKARRARNGSHAHSLLSYLVRGAKWGTTPGSGNNADLKKLKKRARRAAITSDASRPNDRPFVCSRPALCKVLSASR